MSSISWEEYIKSSVLEFRRRYSALSEEDRMIMKKSTRAGVALDTPSQFIIVDPDKFSTKLLICFHAKQYPDLETFVYENMPKHIIISKIQKEEPKWLQSVSLEKIKEAIRSIRRTTTERKDWTAADATREIFLLWFSFDCRSDKDFLAETSLQILGIYLDTEKSRTEIKETVSDIKRDAQSIEVEELRTKILEKTAILEKQIEPLYGKFKKLEDDLVGVRKLVGSETYGEWKSLLSEIDKINTRIDAVSDIRSAYDKVLAQQNEFMKQQSEVMKQQSNFIKWIKYATVLLPIAVISVPIIEIISIIIRHYLGIP